jgi:HK97 family phage prohead protease
MSQVVERSYQFRSDDTDGDGRTIAGYMAVFDQPTSIREDGRTFMESVRRGSFSRAVNGDDPMPMMQYSHGHDPAVGTLPIGRWDECREDDTGLFMRGRLFDTPRVAEIREAIKGSGITGCSFKFEVLEDSWDGESREIRAVRTIEAGPVSQPAYVGTSVGVRSADAGPLTAGQRAQRIRELALRAYAPSTPALDAPPSPSGADPPTEEDAADALAVLDAYFAAMKQGNGSGEPPPLN